MIKLDILYIEDYEIRREVSLKRKISHLINDNKPIKTNSQDGYKQNWLNALAELEGYQKELNEAKEYK